MLKKVIVDVFLEVVNVIESGEFGKKVKIGVIIFGSEYGVENMVNGV